jgi:hypothetical protein
MCRLQEEYGSRGAFTPPLCKLYLCSWPSARAQSAPKRRFGGCIRDTATTEARSIDSDRFAESKSTAARQYGSDTFTGSFKILASASKWTTTSRDYCWGPIARCQVGNSMNKFCSPTTSRYWRYPQQRIHNTFRTLGYAHVTAATRRWSRRSQLSACRCEAQTALGLAGR